jgi:hypothetical protein
MKLTFEAKMDGLERVTQSLNDMNKGFAGINDAAAKLSQSLENLVKTFDVAGKSVQSFVDQKSIDMIKNYSSEVVKLKQEAGSLNSNANMYEQQRVLSEKNGNFATAEMFRQMRDKAGWQEPVPQLPIGAQGPLGPPPPPGTVPPGAGGSGPGGWLNNLIGKTMAPTAAVAGVAQTLSLFKNYVDSEMIRSHGLAMSEKNLDLLQIDPAIAQMKGQGYRAFERQRGEVGAADYAEKGANALMSKEAFMGAGAGFMLGGPIGALIGALGGATAASQRQATLQQIANERTEREYRMGKEMYGARLEPSRQLMIEQGAALEDTEKAYGVQNTLSTTVGFSLQGMTPGMYSNVSNAYARYGRRLTAGDRGLARMQWDYGVSDAEVEQMARRRTGGLSEKFGMYNRAGITGDYFARQEYGRQAAGALAGAGAAATETDIMSAQTSLSGKLMAGGNLTGVEAQQVAGTATATIQSKIEGSDNIFGFNIRSALLSLGVPAAQVPIIIQQTSNQPQKMIRLVAKLTGQPEGHVKDVLNRAFNLGQSAVDQAMGLDDKTKKIFQSEKIDVGMAALTRDQRVTQSGEQVSNSAFGSFFDQSATVGPPKPPAVVDTTKKTEEEVRADGIRKSMEEQIKDAGGDVNKVVENIYKATKEGFDVVGRSVEAAMREHMKSKADQKEKADFNKNYQPTFLGPVPKNKGRFQGGEEA